MKKVHAQRKFAQGAFVPASCVASVVLDRRVDTSKDEPKQAVHSNMSAKSMLDVISFQNMHTHLQPFVLVERLQKSNVCSNEIQSSTGGVEGTELVECNNNKDVLVSNGDTTSIKISRKLKNSRNKVNYNMRLRSRPANPSKKLIIHKEFKKKCIKSSPIKRKATTSVTIRSKRLKRNTVSISEFSMEDYRPLKYLASRNERKKNKSQNTPRLKLNRDDNISRKSISKDIQSSTKETGNGTPLTEQPIETCVPVVDSDGNDWTPCLGDSIPLTPVNCSDKVDIQSLTTYVIPHKLVDDPVAPKDVPNQGYCGTQQIERWMQASTEEVLIEDKEIENLFKVPTVPVTQVQQCCPLPQNIETVSINDSNNQQLPASKNKSPIGNFSRQDYPTSVAMSSCPSERYTTVKDIVLASPQDLKNRCNQCPSCNRVSKVNSLVRLIQRSRGNSGDVYTFDAIRDGAALNAVELNYRQKRGTARLDSDACREENDEGQVYLDMLPQYGSHVVQLTTSKLPNADTNIMRARLRQRSEVNNSGDLLLIDDDQLLGHLVQTLALNSNPCQRSISVEGNQVQTTTHLEQVTNLNKHLNKTSANIVQQKMNSLVHVNQEQNTLSTVIPDLVCTESGLREKNHLEPVEPQTICSNRIEETSLEIVRPREILQEFHSEPVCSIENSLDPVCPMAITSKLVAPPRPPSEPVISELPVQEAESTQCVQVSDNPRSESSSSYLKHLNGKMGEAPIFFPTEEEFTDPITYFEKIMPKASKFGLCKVVAPKGFKPTCTFSDAIRFNVFNQYIARFYTRWNSAAREMCAIKAYLASQSVYFTKPPLLDGLQVNLIKLYHLVQKHGGLKKVIEKKRWARVGEELHFSGNYAERKLDQIYVKYLLPYDTLSHQERKDLLCRVEKAWHKKNCKMMDRAMNPLHRQRRLLGDSDSSEEEIEEDTEMDNALAEAEDCVVTGRTMNLPTFKKVANQAMASYFHGNPRTPADIVQEYWRLMLLGNDHVCVNSASIDTGEEGYGFTKIRSEPYGTHPWNLKMISQNSGNVLRSLGPVLGVTVPTLHLGMVFSTSCWHRDPHGLPWIEYMHSGPKKTWYGIPDEQSENFRRAVEALCPTSCQNKSIWLPSDITMIPPNLLREHNVSLSTVTQEPGEFIVVFPMAYSSSICTGFTQSESVYFATKSWLNTVHQVFQELRESCEPTMFSLEQLLMCVARDPRSPLAVLQRAHQNLAPLLAEELRVRRALLDAPLAVTQAPSHARGRQTKRPTGAWNVRDQDECEVCRTTLYLSKVTGLPSKKASLCLLHALRIIESRQPSLVNVQLTTFYSDATLKGILDELSTKLTSMH